MDNNTIAQISIWTGFVFSILQILAILLALWIAGRAMLRNPIYYAKSVSRESEDIEDHVVDEDAVLPEAMDVEVDSGDDVESGGPDQPGVEFEEQGEEDAGGSWINRGMTIALWLGFAGLITLALSDLLVFLRTLFGIGLGYSVLGMEIFTSNPFSTMWGTVPGGLYSVMFLLLQLVVYLEVIWVGKSFVDRGGPLREAALTRGERWWLVLGAAGLIHEVVQGMVLALIRIELPVASPFADSGLMGYFGIFILALLVVGLGMMWMNSRLLKAEIEREEA